MMSVNSLEKYAGLCFKISALSQFSGIVPKPKSPISNVEMGLFKLVNLS